MHSVVGAEQLAEDSPSKGARRVPPAADRSRSAPAANRTAPSAQEIAVWRAFLRAHAQLIRTLEAELAQAADLPIASYDVLVQLAEAPHHRLRMTDLADRVLLSRSGLTRMIDRLERDALVCREPVPDDARGMYAVLTRAGVDRLRSASYVHLPGISAHFVLRFNRRELDRLGQLLGRLAD
jgi:DNA-binding MarR family transcriptional regulator